MDLHPDFPVVTGRYRVTQEWSLNLPVQLNRRIDEGSLVLWRPKFTLWLEAWNNDKNESPAARVQWLKSDMSLGSYDIKECIGNGVLYLTYRIAEKAEEQRQPALYCFAIGKRGHLQMAFYFDQPEELSMAENICKSATEAAP